MSSLVELGEIQQVLLCAADSARRCCHFVSYFCVVQATVTVYHAAGRSKVTTADELRLDQQEQHPTTVTVGRLKLKVKQTKAPKLEMSS